MNESLITSAEGLAAYPLPTCVRDLLQFLYPTVRWEKVAFFNDIPWWLDAFGSDADATTLPAAFGDEIHVFINRRKLSGPAANASLDASGKLIVVTGEQNYPNDLANLCRPAQSAKVLKLLVHECVHVLQFQEANRAQPLGYLAKGTIEYLQCWACHGFAYDSQLPHEMEAYSQDTQFESCLKSLSLDLTDWCTACGVDGKSGALTVFTTSACAKALVKTTSVRPACCEIKPGAAVGGIAGVAVGILGAIREVVAAVLAVLIGIVATVVKVIVAIVTPIIDLFNSTEDDLVRDDIASSSASNLASRSDAELIEMVRRLFDGPTGDDDENALLRLLSALPCPRVATLASAFGVQAFLDEFQGEEYGKLQIQLFACGVLPVSSLDDDGVRALVAIMNCPTINGLPNGLLHDLFRQLLLGSTGDDDEAAINKLMNCLDAVKIRAIMNVPGTRWDDFDSAIDGAEWDEFFAIIVGKGIVPPMASLDDDRVRRMVSFWNCADINSLANSVLHGLFQKLLSGSTGDDDEQTINKMMGCLDPTKIRAILRMVGTEWDDFDSAIQGSEWTQFLDIMGQKGISAP